MPMDKRQRLADLRALQFRIQDEIDELAHRIGQGEKPQTPASSRLQTISPEERDRFARHLAADRLRRAAYSRGGRIAAAKRRGAA